MTPHDHPYHDLLHRMDLAMLGSCTCVTKTPDIAFHDEKCRYRVLREASAELTGIPVMAAAQRDVGRVQYAQEVIALWTDYKAKAEAYDAMLREFAFRYGAGGYNSDGLIEPEAARAKLEWIVDDAITHAKAALAMANDGNPIPYPNLRQVPVATYVAPDGVTHWPAYSHEQRQDYAAALHAIWQQNLASVVRNLTAVPLRLYERALLNITGDPWREEMQAAVDAAKPTYPDLNK